MWTELVIFKLDKDLRLPVVIFGLKAIGLLLLWMSLLLMLLICWLLQVAKLLLLEIV